MSDDADEFPTILLPARWITDAEVPDYVDELEVRLSDSEDDDDPDTFTLSNVEFQTPEEARQEADEIRQNAPNPRDLGESACDIDALIEILQQAKSDGVDTVYVNDDGIERTPNPRITNNHWQYSGSGPRPGTLREWLEL